MLLNKWANEKVTSGGIYFPFITTSIGTGKLLQSANICEIGLSIKTSLLNVSALCTCIKQIRNDVIGYILKQR